MRWGLLLVCASCLSEDRTPPPRILNATFVASDCATLPPLEEDWMGLPEGCVATVGLKLDLDRMPATATVQVQPPLAGRRETVTFDASGVTEYTFTTPMLAGSTAWRSLSTFSYGVYGGETGETLDYDHIVAAIVRPSRAPSSWLWASHWVNADNQCDHGVSIVAWVGGAPVADTYLDVRVFDVDVGGDTLIESAKVPVTAPGAVNYAPTHLCDPDRPGATGDNVDPRYEVRLFDAADVELDKLDGPEIDL